jgi:hypothetical protein
MYGEFPDLKKAVKWFKSLMPAGEWEQRRDAVAKRFYQSLVGEFVDPTGVGRFFDDRDSFGWYLFLGEAFTDHPWNYEIVFGCRVVPILAAIGRNLDSLLKVEGFVERASRILGSEKSQPNGGLFEVLVAAAYARSGAKVSFKAEAPGQSKTYDLDVELNGKRWAVECKRIELGEYGERERLRMRELWIRQSAQLIHSNLSAILNANFHVELHNVPDDYFVDKIQSYIKLQRASFSWSDEICSGIISCLDLRPIQEALAESYLPFPSPKFNTMLTGRYIRYDNILIVQKVKHAPNPYYLEEVDLAVAARWKCSAGASIDKHARDIIGKLAEANSQLPENIPGVIHIGFEALGDDKIEQHRYEKIINTARNFDSGNKKLEYIYCNYFSPESSPSEIWAFDETVQWLGIDDGHGKPLKLGMVVLPDEEAGRSGVHWIAKEG